MNRSFLLYGKSNSGEIKVTSLNPQSAHIHDSTLFPIRTVKDPRTMGYYRSEVFYCIAVACAYITGVSASEAVGPGSIPGRLIPLTKNGLHSFLVLRSTLRKR